METTEETKSRILSAAEKRFRQYGFNKTTMAEIAKDCGMSAANIYRFYESKQDIVVEIATSCFRETEDSLREVVLRRPGLTASKRVEAFVLQLLHDTHDLHANSPKIYELVEFITMERFDLVNSHIEVKQSLLAEILAEGNKNGEFDVKDIFYTAEMVLKATIMFYFPVFSNIFPAEEMKRFAKGVVDLLLTGLEKR